MRLSVPSFDGISALYIKSVYFIDEIIAVFCEEVNQQLNHGTLIFPQISRSSMK